MESTKWYASKHEIPAPIDVPDTHTRRYVLSRDKPRAQRAGAKEFTTFATMEEACEYVEKRRGGSYYEVLEDGKMPCHMYFDLDRHDNEYPYATMKRHFTFAFQNFMEKTQGVRFDISSGTNAQFCNGTRDGKTSMHVRLDIIAPSVVSVKNMTKLFNAWLTERVQEYRSLIIVDEASRLVGTALDDEVKDHPTQASRSVATRSCIDTNVHSHFQNYRMLHQTKQYEDATRLVPDDTSSDKCIAHTIGCYIPSEPTPLKWMGDEEGYRMTSSSNSREATMRTGPFDKEMEYINTWRGIREHFPAYIRI